jgi:uracil-DNA glycosylase family 4
MSDALQTLTDLTADLRAWVEWEQAMGAVALPLDETPRPVALPPTTSEPSSRPKTVPAPRGKPESPAPRGKPESPAPRGKPESPAASRKSIDSGRWASAARGDDLVLRVGPDKARLCIIRTVGSSDEAEAMFDKMIARVLRVDRERVLILDLSRVRRDSTAFAAAIHPHLARVQPQLIILMGTLAARALLGDAASVGDSRGRWHRWTIAEAGVATRITHHPESVCVARRNGNDQLAKETFEDLRAVAVRLNST